MTRRAVDPSDPDGTSVSPYGPGDPCTMAERNRIAREAAEQRGRADELQARIDLWAPLVTAARDLDIVLDGYTMHIPEYDKVSARMVERFQDAVQAVREGESQ